MALTPFLNFNSLGFNTKISAVFLFSKKNKSDKKFKRLLLKFIDEVR